MNKIIDREFYKNQVIYSSYNYPNEEEVIKMGIDFNLLLEWIDDERKELESEFEDDNHSFNDFGSFCLNKWVKEIQ